MIKFGTNKELEISSEDIGYLVACALEGGINYWCDKANIIEKPDADYEYASDVIGLGGKLLLFDAESDDTWELNQANFLSGVVKAMEHFEYNSVEELMDNHDAEVADVIIQFALFNEIVFG